MYIMTIKLAHRTSCKWVHLHVYRSQVHSLPPELMVQTEYIVTVLYSQRLQSLLIVLVKIK